MAPRAAALLLSASLLTAGACGGDDDDDAVDLCPGDAPIADLYRGVCAGSVKVCDTETGWVEPDYAAIESYEADESTCDLLDNDCDGDVDEAGLNTFYLDHDGDGFGDPDFSAEGCGAAPTGYVGNSSDCDDLLDSINPDANEVCDGIDNDCDDVVDAGPCHEDAMCDDSSGTVACVCTEFHQGDGSTCTDKTWEVISAGGKREYSVNTGFACGILSGELYCWGSNYHGQLGVPRSEVAITHVPRRVGAESDWTAVSAGYEHACGIRSGQLFCWGANAMHNYYGTTGRLGLGDDFDDIDYVATPTRVGEDSDWSSVSCAKSHSCALKTDGTVYCWGRNTNGQLGNNDTGTDHNSPQQEAGQYTDWVEVSAGKQAFTLGIRDNTTERTLWMWGGNSAITNYEPSAVPTLVTGSTTWTTIAAGARAACGIQAGELWCWGDNRHGQVAQGDFEEETAPQRVGSESDWVSVSGGQGFFCGIRNTDDLYCWGRGYQLELGIGADLSELEGCADSGMWLLASPSYACNVPMLVDATQSWTEVDTGWSSFACATDDDVDLWCWGKSAFGEAGLDPDTDPGVPLPTKID